MKKKLYYLLLTILFALGNSFAAAIALKANIGVGSFDALYSTIAQITNIKVGTMLIILCLFCMLISVAVLRKETKPTILLQMVIPLIGGYVVNFFYYNILTFEINSYYIRFLFFIFSAIVSPIMVAGLMRCDILFYPLEGLCNVLANKTKKDFKFWRQFADVVCITCSIVLSLIFHISLSIREGTIISALTFGPICAYFIKIFHKIIK